MWRGCDTGTQINTFQIDINYIIKLTFFHLDQSTIFQNPSIIDQNIHADICIHYSLKKTFHAFFIPYICLNKQAIYLICCGLTGFFI